MDFGNMKYNSSNNPFISFLSFKLFAAFLLLILFICPGGRVLHGNEDWLEGWNNRIGLTINHKVIDDKLTDFPVMIYLSDSSGANSANLTRIFEELDSCWKKIAITAGDGVTQCYVEVEKWEPENNQAWLWVKVPHISSVTDTKLYLYYDGKRPDNTDYVGDPVSVAGQSVWSNNYLCVLPGQNYNGSDEALIIGNNYLNQKLSGSSGATFSAWIYPSSLRDGDGHDRNVIAHIPVGDSSAGYFLALQQGGRLVFGGKSCTEDDFQSAESVYPVTENGKWQHIVGVLDYTGNRITAYVEGELILEKNAEFTSSSYDAGSGGAEVIGGNTDLSPEQFFHGIMDGVTFSGTARSPAWIKAEYYSGSDSLISFFPDNAGVYHIAGDEEVTGKAKVTVKPLIYHAQSQKLHTYVTLHNSTDETYKFAGTVEVFHNPKEAEPLSVGTGDYTTNNIEGGATATFRVMVDLQTPMEMAHEITISATICEEEEEEEE